MTSSLFHLLLLKHDCKYPRTESMTSWWPSISKLHNPFLATPPGCPKILPEKMAKTGGANFFQTLPPPYLPPQTFADNQMFLQHLARMCHLMPQFGFYIVGDLKAQHSDTASLPAFPTSSSHQSATNNVPKKATSCSPVHSNRRNECFSIDNILKTSNGNEKESNSHSPSTSQHFKECSETVGYTIDALQLSDGRSKRKKLFIKKEEIEVSSGYQDRYICNQCGKSYATSSNLSRHKQTHRSLDSPHAKKCPTCDRVYVSMPALSMHLLTHKAVHKCTMCNKNFSRPWLLQGHMRAHTGQKPFGCAHCGKAFADRSNLRAHMHTHSGVKRHGCSGCGKLFALKSYLNKHIELVCPVQRAQRLQEVPSTELNRVETSVERRSSTPL